MNNNPDCHPENPESGQQTTNQPTVDNSPPAMSTNTPEPFAPRCTKCFFFTSCTDPWLPDTDDTHAKFCPFYLPYPKY